MSTKKNSRVHGDSVLLGFLSLLNRPAVAISGAGATLAANKAFRKLSSTAGGEFFEWFTPTSRARMLAAIASGSFPAHVEADFHGGTRWTVHLAGMELAPAGEPVYLAVLESRRTRGRDGGEAAVGTAMHRMAPLRPPSLHHDLAGPLTAVLGTAELLLLRERELSREVRDSLGQILENCGRMSEILMRDRHAAAEDGKNDLGSRDSPGAGKAAP